MGIELRKIAHLAIRAPEYRHLRPGPKLLLLILADRVSDEHGEFWAGQRRAAQWLGVSEPTYRKYRAALVDVGLLRRLTPYHRGRAARWQVFPAVFGHVSENNEVPSSQPKAGGSDVGPSGGNTPDRQVGTRWSSRTGVTEENLEVVEHLRKETGRTSAETTVEVDMEEAIRNVLEGFEGALLVG